MPVSGTRPSKLNYSLVSWILGAVLLICSGSVFYPRWEKGGGEAQLSWDAGGYYWYLPSAFIYHDMKGQQFKDSILQKYSPTPPEDFQYGYRHASGNYVIRYTMGMAILEAPSFFIAHLIARPLGYPADGFSLPYQLMVYLGGLLFALAGLWYLRKLLLYYYSDGVAALVLLLLVLGTNYLNYAGIDVGMTHTWLFTIYVFILLNTHHYYRTFQRKYALRLGALIGLAALIRPPELISVLIPLLWGMERISLSAIKERISLFKKQWRHLLAAALICFLILSLQLLYWKYATGSWLVYTYQDQGFSWLHPHFKQYALNFQCGWLIYTPMMLVALAGLITFVRSGKNKVAILALIFVNYYIVAAWDAWDYGGRAMVQNYPLLLFPLASLIHFLCQKKIRLLIAAPVLILFTYYNLWWTYQAHKGSIMGSVPATGAYYRATALRYEVPEEIQKLRDNEDLYRKQPNDPVAFYANALTGNIIIINDHQESFSFPVNGERRQWIRASADIHIDRKEWNVWYMTQFIIRLKKGDQVLQENSIRLQRFLTDGQTRNITVDAHRKSMDYDHIEILFRNDNNGSLPCTISNLKVTGFNE